MITESMHVWKLMIFGYLSIHFASFFSCNPVMYINGINFKRILHEMLLIDINFYRHHISWSHSMINKKDNVYGYHALFVWEKSYFMKSTIWIYVWSDTLELIWWRIQNIRQENLLNSSHWIDLSISWMREKYFSLLCRSIWRNLIWFYNINLKSFMIF